MIDTERMREIANGAALANLLVSLFPSCVLAMRTIAGVRLGAAAMSGAWAFGLSAVISLVCIVASESRVRSRSVGGGTALVCVVVAQGLFYLQAFGQSMLTSGLR